MGEGTTLAPIDITVLVYDLCVVENDVEVFWLWHGAEHRMAELIEKWGDVPNWQHKHVDGVVTASNTHIGAVIKIFKRKVEEGGSKS
jgi:hypothetical protein